MSPSILIIGSTGNTGAEVVRVLPSLIAKNSALAKHRILALTRNANGKVAQELSKVTGVEIIEKNWTDIDADWLRENEVERLYSACHNEATQFADESLLYNAVREAGVKYAVRLSTTHESVSADNLVPYGRAHWAIEAMLSDPSFNNLQWSSLQPMVFHPYVVGVALDWVKEYRKTGQKGKLDIMLGETKGVYSIDANEVGVVAAHLLASDDTSIHNRKKYILRGPEAITGRQIVDQIERHTGVKVDDVRFNSLAFIDQLGDAGWPKNLVKAMKRAMTNSFADEGKAPASAPTSPEIMEVYAPKISAVEYLHKELANLKQKKA
jgi:uncharacterized protein YbjT (DUF2867 family)